MRFVRFGQFQTRLDIGVIPWAGEEATSREGWRRKIAEGEYRDAAFDSQAGPQGEPGAVFPKIALNCCVWGAGQEDTLLLVRI